MRDRWMVNLVIALSALAMASAIAFACSRTVPPEEVSPGTPDTNGGIGTPEQGGPEETRAADVSSGPVMFETRCSRCHSLVDVVAFVEERAADEREGYLTKLLDRHYPPPPEQRPVLVQYLIAEATPR